MNAPLLQGNCEIWRVFWGWPLCAAFCFYPLGDSGGCNDQRGFNLKIEPPRGKGSSELNERISSISPSFSLTYPTQAGLQQGDYFKKKSSAFVLAKFGLPRGEASPSPHLS